MTDEPDLPDNADDELASAYLDGEVTPEEGARVEGDPRLLARVDALGAVRDALRAAPIEPPPVAARDNALRAAVGATTVVDLSAERARRRIRIASVAAAIVVALGIAGVLLRSSDDSGSTHFAAVANSIGATTTSPTGERAAAAGAGSVAHDLSAEPSLGSFTDQTSLVDATRSAFNAPKQAATPDAEATAGAPASPSECGGPDGSVFTASAVLDQRPVRIDVLVQSDGTQTIVVTDVQTCTMLFTQSL